MSLPTLPLTFYPMSSAPRSVAGECPPDILLAHSPSGERIKVSQAERWSTGMGVVGWRTYDTAEFYRDGAKAMVGWLPVPTCAGIATSGGTVELGEPDHMAAMVDILKVIAEKVTKIADQPVFDPQAPVNVYGENFAEAIQNSIERGQRGISTTGG